MSEIANISDGSDPSYRISPNNIEIEQALLGALLINNRALEKVSEFLKSEHFYVASHGRIYDAIIKMVERGQDASPATLKHYFSKDEDLDAVGGGDYLTDLAANVISTVNVEDYGKTVHELHLRRSLIDLGEEIVNDAYEHDLDVSPSRQIEKAEKQLFDLATLGDFKGGFIPFHTSLTTAISLAETAFKNVGSVTGVTTGLTDLDKKLGGLQKSDLLILAGRPSMGKTALATNIAYNAAKAYSDTDGQSGAVVGFFSLEMSADQLAARILADVAEVPSDQIRRGEVKDTDFHKFVEASNVLANLPLFIDDTPALTIGAVRTRARRLQRTENLGMVVIDYLQLLQGSMPTANRVNEVSEITRGLKALAKELAIPVLALSQLSRQVENRDNKRPQLSDLRESGSIEQDADAVMFVYREEYYLERDEPGRKPEENDDKFNQRYSEWQQRLQEVHGTAECIIGKQRHGPIGPVRMAFYGPFTRFSDLAISHDDR